MRRVRGPTMSMAVLLVLALAGCAGGDGPGAEGEDAASEPSAATPPPQPAAGGPGRQVAAELLLAEAGPLATTVQTGAAGQLLGTCEGGIEHGIAIRGEGAAPDEAVALRERYLARWADAGWDPVEEGDVVRASTGGLGLLLSVIDGGAILVATLPCAPADAQAPLPSLSEQLGTLEPLAIEVMEFLVGPEAWTSESVDRPCGDGFTETVLTLQGQVAGDPDQALEGLRSALAARGLVHADLAAAAVGLSVGDVGVMHLSVDGTTATLVATSFCRPAA